MSSFVGAEASSGLLNDRVGAVHPFNTTMIKSRVSISFIPVKQVYKYKDNELSSWSIEDTVQAARDEWNPDVLSNIRVDTAAQANKVFFIILWDHWIFYRNADTCGC